MRELEDAYISTAEAAKALGIHPLSIHKLIYSKKIPAFKLAGHWLISRAFLIDFARSYRPKKGRPKASEEREKIEGEDTRVYL